MEAALVTSVQPCQSGDEGQREGKERTGDETPNPATLGQCHSTEKKDMGTAGRNSKRRQCCGFIFRRKKAYTFMSMRVTREQAHNLRAAAGEERPREHCL